MGRNLIVWSGGADSTAMLNHYAGVSCKDYPVRSISVNLHPYIDNTFMNRQLEARLNYLDWAKKKGYWIENESVSLSGTFRIDFKKGKVVPPQMVIWLGAVMPCVSDGDRVLFSYIKEDGIWHYKREFIDAFHAMCAIKGIDAKVEFPFEWHYKYQILDMLKKNRIPKRCWWSCESPRGKRPCGKCNKCLELRIAEIEKDYLEPEVTRRKVDS